MACQAVVSERILSSTIQHAAFSLTPAWLQSFPSAPLLAKTGAGSRTRTDDLLITNQLLYQLSYAGEGKSEVTRITTLKRKHQKGYCNLAFADHYSQTRE